MRFAILLYEMMAAFVGMICMQPTYIPTRLDGADVVQLRKISDDMFQPVPVSLPCSQL